MKHFKSYIRQANAVDTSSQLMDLEIDESSKATRLSNLDEQDKARNADNQLELTKADPKPDNELQTPPTEDAKGEDSGSSDESTGSVENVKTPVKAPVSVKTATILLDLPSRVVE